MQRESGHLRAPPRAGSGHPSFHTTYIRNNRIRYLQVRKARAADWYAAAGTRDQDGLKLPEDTDDAAAISFFRITRRQI